MNVHTDVNVYRVYILYHRSRRSSVTIFCLVFCVRKGRLFGWVFTAFFYTTNTVSLSSSSLPYLHTQPFLIASSLPWLHQAFLSQLCKAEQLVLVGLHPKYYLLPLQLRKTANTLWTCNHCKDLNILIKGNYNYICHRSKLGIPVSYTHLTLPTKRIV